MEPQLEIQRTAIKQAQQASRTQLGMQKVAIEQAQQASAIAQEASAVALEQSQESNRDLGKALQAVTSDYSACVKAQMEKLDKPKDSAQFSGVAKLIWQKIRALTDHAGGAGRFEPMGINQVAEDLFNTLNRMGTDVSIDDSWEYSRSSTYSMVEWTLGGNHHTGKYHAAALLDWVERQYDAAWRGKTCQQVWGRKCDKKSVERVKPRYAGKVTREMVRSAYEGLATALARLGGIQMYHMVMAAFDRKDALFKRRQVDRRTVTWGLMAQVADLELLRLMEELSTWAIEGLVWTPTNESLQFVECMREAAFPMAAPMPVLCVDESEPWFQYHVTDPIEMEVRHGKIGVVEWQRMVKGAGAVEPEAADRHPANFALVQAAGTAEEYPLGRHWEEEGIHYEAISRQQVDHSEALMMLPACGALPDRDVAVKKIRYCIEARKGICAAGASCEYSHDKALMKEENARTAHQTCHQFTQNGSCEFGHNCRFIHQKPDFH